MFTIKKSFLLWVAAALCLMVLPVQATYYASACGACAKPDADPDAVGFYNTISQFTNWTGNFYNKYLFCNEVDYKSAVYSGNENTVIDTSHIHYHVGHGGAHLDSINNQTITAIVFAAVLEDAKYLDAGEAASCWGDNTLDWIALRCCQLLDDTSYKYWAETMQGLHLILGFKTVSYVDDNFGSTWANQMQKVYGVQGSLTFILAPSTIAQCWYNTVDLTQPTDVIARVIGETQGCYSDYLYGMGSVSADPTPDNTKYYWDHQATPVFLVGNPSNINSIIKRAIPAPNVSSNLVRQIGGAFGFGPSDPVIDLGDTFVMTRPDDENPDPDNPIHVLTVYKNSGIYNYMNLSRLWKIDAENPVIPGIYPAGNAAQRAYEFLTDSSHINLYPGDVGSYAVGEDQIVQKNIDTSETTVYPVYRCVGYSRALEAASGVSVPVVGPGARLKVYIDEDGAIMGALGNWRAVQAAGTVNIMSKTAAWNLFVQNGQEASLAPIYLEYDNVQTDLNTARVGYYEYDASKSQTELIPVWIFNVNYYRDGNLVMTAHTYIPAEL